MAVSTSLSSECNRTNARYLNWLHSWSSFRLEAPAPNKHYEQEMRTIRCNLGPDNAPRAFDPVVIEAEPDQSGLKRSCPDS